MLRIVAFFVFLAVLHVFLLLYRLLTGKKVLINQRLQTYTSKSKLAEAIEKNIGKASQGILARVSRVFKSRSLTQRLEAELAQADLPVKGEEFITITLISTLGPALLAILLTQNLGLGVFLALAGFLGPNLVLKISQSKRLTQFNLQLPDALTVMGNSLRAGFSFFQAMEMVGKEMPSPIALEFNRVLREMNLGTSTEESLNKLGGRVRSEDLGMVITAVLIQRQVGGNLAEVLDKISHTIRDRIRIKGEVKTLTAQGRISGLVIGLLPIALLAILMVINPSYVTVLFTHPVGIALLAAGICSELVGMLLIQKMVNIKI